MMPTATMQVYYLNALIIFSGPPDKGGEIKQDPCKDILKYKSNPTEFIEVLNYKQIFYLYNISLLWNIGY